MIVSFTDGRIRIRHPALKDPENMRALASLLESLPGARGVLPNPRTGSLLFRYDPEQISRENLLAAEKVLQTRLGPAQERPSAYYTRKRENVLLGAALSACMLGLAVSPRLHVWAGFSFVLLTMGHVLRRS
ncbi:MAG: cation transporter [Deltaproteobacteria bacterium]|jgi:hypothetical protein|nr:cation transporter [Deltaproteobacteria bacterium]